MGQHIRTGGLDISTEQVGDGPDMLVVGGAGDTLEPRQFHLSDPGLARWQDRLNPHWRAFAWDCTSNRSTEETIRAVGFTSTDIEHGGVQEELALVRSTVWGRAV
jgi:hypothetical protein